MARFLPQLICSLDEGRNSSGGRAPAGAGPSGGGQAGRAGAERGSSGEGGPSAGAAQSGAADVVLASTVQPDVSLIMLPAYPGEVKPQISWRRFGQVWLLPLLHLRSRTLVLDVRVARSSR